MNVPTASPSTPHHSIAWSNEAAFGFDYIDGRRWRLQAEFRFYYGGPTYEVDGCVPAGFITDFHSVPKALWWLVNPNEYGQAAVIHDHLYRGGSGVPRSIADEIYLCALDKCGCPEWRRKGMYRALRMFGMRAYRKPLHTLGLNG